MPKPNVKVKKTIIAIPSYGRWFNYSLALARKQKFCTASYITPKYRPLTRMYVEPDQLERYHNSMGASGFAFRNAAEADVPKKWGSIMDLIIDRECSNCDHLVIMDDDLALAVRPLLPEKPTKFVNMSPVWFDHMIESLARVTNFDYPLASVQYRQFCQGKTSVFEFNQRVSMVWSLDAEFFRTHPQFRFYRGSNLDFMSDYHFFLNLLVHGHGNTVLNMYTKDDVPNATGGEKDKRKMEVFNSAVTKFAGMYPDFVTTRVKEGKGNWDDGMLGVTINAAAAFDSYKGTA